MATKPLQAVVLPTPVPPAIANGVANGEKARGGDTRTVIIVHGQGQEGIVSVFADVLGKPFRLATSFRSVADAGQGTVIGLRADDAKVDIHERDRSRIVAIHTHCVNLGMPPDLELSRECDYEFLYTEKPFFRRDLSRFISFTLGQINHHEALITKPRTYFISTTFPDVRTALPNLDILTVGSDAVELRVDLLKEPLADGTFSSVPSISYVGEQVMLLRQRTELPIIFTTRCTKENGKFPMENPQLFYEYLYRAVQWGVEYIDVEIWLPEEIRRNLYEKRGNSKIISAFHDFSGAFRWPSERAQEIFRDSRRYGDIVKMITVINDVSENYELEYFRSQIRANNPSGPALSAVNMGHLGQISRAFNTVFSPITHPLLPIVAAPGQMSAAEINGALATMSQLPRKTIFAITSRPSAQTAFFEKCFNELGLTHRLSAVDRGPKGNIESFCSQPDFGGAYLNPPIAAAQAYIPQLSDAARAIGAIDTITAHATAAGSQLIGDNAMWKGIRATLTRDFAPAAYRGRAAIVVASSADDASTAVFALRSLNVGTIYTVGFRAGESAPGAAGLWQGSEAFTGVESVQRVEMPVVVVSALPPSRSHLVQPLLRHFGAWPGARRAAGKAAESGSGRIFVDLASGPRKGDPRVVAEACGWTCYGVADTGAFATVEVLRLLVGQNVPYSFVRLASGRSLS
jgi:3-dehydroquinate dehydratase-1